MIVSVQIQPHYPGFIAGQAEGIVTAGGQPASKPVIAMDALTLHIMCVGWSLANGHYLLRGLDPARKYLLMARDTQRGYEPVAYDWIEPSTALTGDEQASLWQSWL